jgi:hypothetical protein
MEVTYHVQAKGCGPVSAELNGVSLDFTRENNPYRLGALRVDMKTVTGLMTEDTNRLRVMIE